MAYARTTAVLLGRSPDSGLAGIQRLEPLFLFIPPYTRIELKETRP